MTATAASYFGYIAPHTDPDPDCLTALSVCGKRHTRAIDETPMNYLYSGYKKLIIQLFQVFCALSVAACSKN